MIYDETTKEVYIDTQKGIKPKGSNNHNTDKADIFLNKEKQGIQRKEERGQKVRKTEKKMKSNKIERQKGRKESNNMQKKLQYERILIILMRS